MIFILITALKRVMAIREKKNLNTRIDSLSAVTIASLELINFVDSRQRLIITPKRSHSLP